MDNNILIPNENNFIFYTTRDGAVKISVIIQGETIWLTQKAIGELFGKSKATISEHLKNIYAEGELQREATVRNFRTVQTEGERQVERELEYFNLDAEIIYTSADAAQLNMGLTSWKNAPEGKILKSDTQVAKNYLSEQHISELNRIVSAYLDLAENRAERQITMTMADWVAFLDRFLELSDYPILTDKGKVSALEAKLKAAQEYDKFRQIQDQTYLSDFDKQVRHLTSGKDRDDP